MAQGYQALQSSPSSCAASQLLQGWRNNHFHNGKIYTLENDSKGHVEAVVVRDGKIIFTGLLSGADANYSEATRYDLNGNCMLPGFIDPHVHFILTALRKYYFVDVSMEACPKINNVLARIRGAVSNGGFSSEWVVCFGYDPSRHGDEQYPNLTREMLDGCSPADKSATPIYVLNPSCHIAYVNSEAFRLHEITPDSVAGNWMYEISKDGQLSGQVFEDAVAAMASKIRPPSRENLLDWCQNTLKDMVAEGCTTFLDVTVGLTGLDSYELPFLCDLTEINGGPPLRYLGAYVDDYLSELAEAGEELPQPGHMVGNISIDRVKLYTDGSTQGFTAALREAYFEHGEVGNKYLTHDDKELHTLMTTYRDLGYRLIVHANGDLAIDQVNRVFKSVYETEPPKILAPGMDRIDHYTVTDEAQIIETQKLGIGISHLIGHVSYWGDPLLNHILSSPRAEVVDPLALDEKAHAIFSLHSDSPVTEIRPLRYLHNACTRLIWPYFRETLGEKMKIDILPALKSITKYPAQQMGIEEKTGTLEVGKMADMVILDTDILEEGYQVEWLNTVHVVETWYEGVKVYPTKAQE